MDFGELWRNRGLLYFFAWRDVNVRYKQTILGAAWAILQLVILMVIFTIIFGKQAKIPSDGVPYALFSFAGLLPWLFLQNSVSQCGVSLVTQAPPGQSHSNTRISFHSISHRHPSYQAACSVLRPARIVDNLGVDV